MSVFNSDVRFFGLSLPAAQTTQSSFQVESKWGTVDLLHEIADEWMELCREGPCEQPFYRPEWIAAAIQAFFRHRRVLLITVRRGGRLRAVLPLVEEKGFGTGTRLRSASMIPRFELVHGPGAEAADAVRAAWQHLRQLRNWDVIELANVPEGGAAELLVTAAKEDSFPTGRHEFARTPYALLHEHKPVKDFSHLGRSSRFRGQLRQGWREISKRGSVRLRRTEKADAATLQGFYRLEQSGWKGREATAILSKKELQSFYDAIASYAEQFGYLSMYFLEVDDVPVAAHLGLTYAGRYYPIKVAYDENYSQYRPGHLIIGRVLEDCIERGIIEVDFLGDWTEAKAKWTSDVRPHVVCRVFRNSAIGHLLHLQDDLRHKLTQSLRKAHRSAMAVAGSYMSRAKNGKPRSGRGDKNDSPQPA